MKILVNLIGGQPAPNVIAAKEVKADRIVNVFTPETETQHKRICDSLKITNSEGHFKVDPYQIKSNIDASIDIIRKYSDSNELILNFTGGTKIMSSVFYNQFANSRLRCVYMDSENKRFIEIDASGVSERKLSSKLKIEEYLNLHGQRAHSTEIRYSQDYLHTMNYLFENLNSSLTSLIKKILTGKPNNEKNGMKEFLKGPYKVNLNTKSSTLSLSSKNDSEVFALQGKDSVGFFSGGWYEYKFFSKLKESNTFDEVVVNVKIPNADLDSAKNELDAVAIKKDNLFIFECKSGKVTQADINKLRSIKDLFGKYSRLYLISYFPIANDTLLEKIREFGINHILYNSKMRNFGHILDKIDSPSRNKNINL